MNDIKIKTSHVDRELGVPLSITTFRFKPLSFIIGGMVGGTGAIFCSGEKSFNKLITENPELLNHPSIFFGLPIGMGYQIIAYASRSGVELHEENMFNAKWDLINYGLGYGFGFYTGKIINSLFPSS